MGFSLNAFLSSIFGNKATRDIKEIRPIVEQVLRIEPEIKGLSNDALRSRLDEIKANLQDSVKDLREKVAELNSKIEETDIDKRQPIFDEIDKTEQHITDRFEEELNKILPTVYAIVKDTARRSA